MNQCRIEFGAQDASTAARGLDWRMTGAALAVPGIYTMCHVPFHLEFWDLSVAGFLMTVLLIGQGIFAFGTGYEMRKWRWRNRIVFVCDLACLLLFATSFLRGLYFHCGGSEAEFFVIWGLFATGMLLRASFYCSLARRIRAGWVASLIYGISLIPLFVSFPIYVLNFGFGWSPAWLWIPERIMMISACVAIPSALCMWILLRVRLFRLAHQESEFSLCQRLVRVLCRILILILIFGSFFTYGKFCFAERDRIYEAKNRALMESVHPHPEAPQPERSAKP